MDVVGSNRWFDEVYTNPVSVKAWAADNITKFSRRVIPSVNLGVECKERCSNTNIIEECNISKRKKRTLSPPRLKRAYRRKQKQAPSVLVTVEEESTEEDEVEEKQKPPAKRKSKQVDEVDGPVASDKLWWFSEISTLDLKSLVSQPATVITHKVQFDGMRVVLFKNMYYLKQMFDGSAVGNLSMVHRAEKRAKNIIAPFLLRRGACNTEKECCIHAAKTFDKIWFHTVLQTTNPEKAEKLLLWKDLLEANVNHRQELLSLVNDFFERIARENIKLATFLKMCLKRALSVGDH